MAEYWIKIGIQLSNGLDGNGMIVWDDGYLVTWHKDQHCETTFMYRSENTLIKWQSKYGAKIKGYKKWPKRPSGPIDQ